MKFKILDPKFQINPKFSFPLQVKELNQISNRPRQPRPAPLNLVGGGAGRKEIRREPKGQAPNWQTLNFKIKKFLPKVKENVDLKAYTTFKIGGPAKYFFIAKTKADLIRAIKVAKELRLPFFILGGGSNLLVSDKGFKGLVINFQFSIFNFQKNKILVGAGTKLAKLVNFGLEWAIGIPGTVGGAVYGNAGAFGKSMKDFVKEVEVFDTKTEKVKIFKNKNCQFGYRESIFKKKKNLIILSVKIKTKKSNPKKIKQYLDYRKKTQPLNLPSAGSIFKNPSIAKNKNFFAGQLIEKAGLKGKKIGNVQISEKHANFIVNLGNGKAKDVLKLIKLIKNKIKKQFKIKLEEEIQYLGFKN